MRSLIVVLLIVMMGCSDRPSAIVDRAEAAGAGNLSAASQPAMQMWLERHRDVARDLDRMCSSVRNTAPAEWADTIEGRLCAAARIVAASSFKPLKSDHKTFESGWK